MFKKLRSKIENKRNSNKFFWKSLLFGKDLVWKFNRKSVTLLTLFYNILKNYYSILKNYNKKGIGRCVITRRRAGFGDCIVSAMNAWYYALKTKRKLVIDWRKSNYLGNDQNLFSKFFETPRDLGVDIICDDSIKNLKFTKPFFPYGLKLYDPYKYDPHNKEITELLLKLKDVTAGTIVIDKGPMNLEIPEKQQKRFLSSLKLKPKYWKEVKNFQKEFLLKRPIIGVHIRHGNGEKCPYFIKRGGLINDLSKFLKKIRNIIIEEGKQFNGNYDVFLCTDSSIVVDEFKKLIPSIIFREKWMPPINTGPVHVVAKNMALNHEKCAADALIDMYLLSFCDVLVCKKKGDFCYLPRKTMKKKNAVVRFIDNTK
jgi:hypothetical protein